MKAKHLLAGVSKPVSELALGTAHFANDQKDLWFDLLDRFAGDGGTTIDTARIYGDSEDIIGEWMGNNRDRMLICTKGGHGDHILPRENPEKIIETELIESLEHLQTDYIDMYWLHRDNPEVPVGVILECLNEQVSCGRIRAFGGSNWTYNRVAQAEEYASENGLTGFAAVSNNLSLAVQSEPFYPGLVSCDEAGLHWHRETGKPLFAWSSQARGFFTGNYRSRDLTQLSDRFLKRMAEVYCTDHNLERLDRAERLAKEKGNRTTVQIALAWLIGCPVDMVPVVGPRNETELASCMEALSIQLTESERRWLNLETESID